MGVLKVKSFSQTNYSWIGLDIESHRAYKKYGNTTDGCCNLFAASFGFHLSLPLQHCPCSFYPLNTHCYFFHCKVTSPLQYCCIAMLLSEPAIRLWQCTWVLTCLWVLDNSCLNSIKPFCCFKLSCYLSLAPSLLLHPCPVFSPGHKTHLSLKFHHYFCLNIKRTFFLVRCTPPWSLDQDFPTQFPEV